MLATAADAGEFNIGSGATVDLGSGSLDLGCGDLTVDGMLMLSSGAIQQARHVATLASGTLEGGSGSLELAGDWSNSGSFSAGTSTVSFTDGCGLARAVITGDTTFANLSIMTTVGFLYDFVAGSTQTITNSLALFGAAGNLLTIRSTVGGIAAFLNVQGTGSGDFVDVEDNDATAGSPIALGPNSVNGSNTSGWLIGPLPELALDFTGGVSGPPFGDTVGGWEFILSAPAQVNALGVWDEGGDGLQSDHDIGLYTIGQDLLASATLSSGSGTTVPSSSTSGSWVFTSIAPIVLSPGTYVVAATYVDADLDAARFNTVATERPGITFVSNRLASAAMLTFPTDDTQLLDDGVFGANLRLQTPLESVPALSARSFVVLASALALLAFWQARRGTPHRPMV